MPNAAHVLSDSGDEEYNVKDDERRSRQKVHQAQPRPQRKKYAPL